MRRIVLDMQCAMFAEAIARALKSSDPDYIIRRSQKPSDTAALCRSSHACVLLMEVTGSALWSLSERLKIRDAVKTTMPDCKIALLVDEKADAPLADAVRQAKKDGLVDNFIYCSVSPSYLFAVIDTL